MLTPSAAPSRPDLAPARRCAVCAAALPPAQNAAAATGAYPSCHAVACRMAVSRRGQMSEPNFRHYLDMQAEHRRYILARTAALAARELAEAGENETAWNALRARLPAAADTQPLRLLLPTGPRRSCRLPQERRARYRMHLLRIIEEARTLAPDAAGLEAIEEPPSGGSGMAARLCAFCGGGCCTKGGERAYLDAATLRRFMDAQPGIADEAVLQAYLDRVAPVTRSGSCINQTATGCSLPRAMRSDVCNRFACEPLARLEAAQEGTVRPQTVLIVRRRQDHWQRTNPELDNAINAGAILGPAGLRRVAFAVLPGASSGSADAGAGTRDAAVVSGSKTLQACTSSPILVEQNAAGRTGE
jgi:hypothetical protein